MAQEPRRLISIKDWRGTVWYLKDYFTKVTLSSDDEVTGVLPASHGGTGKNKTTYVLVDLEKSTRDAVFQDNESSHPDNCEPGVRGYLQPEHGGTGQSSLSGIRNALGLGDSGVNQSLQIGFGGTGARTAADARANLGVPETKFINFNLTENNTASSVVVLNAAPNYEYTNNYSSGMNGYLKFTLPIIGNLTSTSPKPIFSVNFTSGPNFKGLQFQYQNEEDQQYRKTVKYVGDATNAVNKRYNIVIWYDGTFWWCAAKYVDKTA